jgi:class 3 adenylate cyclase
MNEPEQLEQAIAALEAQRGLLGDAVVDAGLRPMRERLAELRAAAAPGMQRKQVTVLFADVAGFTSLAERLDAEEVGDTLNALWRRLDELILAHGGRVDKHMGDAVMALWGAGAAQENDPERAVRAALAMQEAIADLGLGIADLAAAAAAKSAIPNPQFAIRIGVHTGPVLLGSMGTTREYTAIGDTVNTAQRLQELAAIGEVVISQAVYLHTRGAFEAQFLGEVGVKGKAQPVQAYRVLGAGAGTHTRGVEGVATRMVGRASELAQLQDAYQATVRAQHLRLVTISGDAGLGKTRLLAEFEAWLAEIPGRRQILRGRARPETEHLPYGLLRDLFSDQFQIREDDPAHVARARLEAGFAWHDSPQRAHIIGALLGLDFSDSPYLAGLRHDPQQLRDRARLYLRDYFRAATERQPLLIVLEDVHWADESSLDLLEKLLPELHDRALCVIALARPSLYERRPGWGRGRAWQQQIMLAALPVEACHELVAGILQRLERPAPDLEAMIVARAEGNPFYVEELVNMLIDRGAIVRDDPHWLMRPERLAEVHVPSTLTGLLQARLDSLSEVERQALQRAAVVGRTFWEETVAHIDRAVPLPAGDAAAPPVWERLRRRELIFPRAATAFAGTREFAFKHAMLQSVSYESVLLRERPVYHDLVAGWLIAHSGERAGEFAGLIGEHLERAGKPAEAAVFLKTAGERAAERFANVEAARYFEHALALAPATDAAGRYDLLMTLLHAEERLGREDRWSDVLEQAAAQAETLDDDRRRLEVALRRAVYLEAQADYPAMQTAAQEAARLAAATGERGGAAQYMWGRALWRQQSWAEATERLAQALTLAHTAGEREVEADCMRTLGLVQFSQGDFASARATFEHALVLHRAAGDRRGECYALNNLGNIALRTGDLPRSLALVRQAIDLAREIGDQYAQTWLSQSLADLYETNLGDLAAAGRLYEEIERDARVQDNRNNLAVARSGIGSTALFLGDLAGARAALEEAAALNTALGRRRNLGWESMYLGLLHHWENDATTALDHSRRAIELAQETGDDILRARAANVMAYVQLAQGDWDAAQAAAEQALPASGETELTDESCEARALLAAVALVRGDAPAVDDVLAYLDEHPAILFHAAQPARIYVTCHAALQRAGDARAAAVLAQGRERLEAQAAALEDAGTRAQFLALPPNRALLEAADGSS